MSLSKILEECDFGIACLTPKHLHADWILFECGALASVSTALESSGTLQSQ